MKDDLHKRIEERAYLLAEASGFPPGRDRDFWLQAEAEVMGGLSRESLMKKTAAKTSKKAASADISEKPPAPAAKKTRAAATLKTKKTTSKKIAE